MFLETLTLTLPRFPTDQSFNSPGGPEFNTDVSILESGFEQRNQYWPEARRSYDVGYGVRSWPKIVQMLELFELAGGRESGFRYRDPRDWKSVRITTATVPLVNDPISAFDQVISVDLTTQDIFQLAKTFWNANKKRRREISKPVVSTVLVGIQGVIIPPAQYDLLYVPTALQSEGHLTTGRVTLAANIQKTITGITQASSARVTATGHGLTLGYSVHFKNVVGMTEINGRRGLVTNIVDANNFDVNINSTGFTAYTSGGQINTRRQSLALTLTITAITKALSALVTTSAAHGLVPGDMGTFASVAGMTQMNSLVGTVMAVPSATTFNVNIDSRLFSTYASGGTFTTAERVTAGFEFDVPVRFDVDKLPTSFIAWTAGSTEVPLIEIRVI